MMKLYKNLSGRLLLMTAFLAFLMLGHVKASAQVPGNDNAILYVIVKLYASHPAFSQKHGAF